MKKGLTTSLLVFALILSFSVPALADQNVTGNVTENETNQILINEFVVDPQTNWNGVGGIGTQDEWFELYNPQPIHIDLTNWTLLLIDSGTSTEILDGIIPALGYLLILDPEGSQSNDGRLELYDADSQLVDVVTYGDYDDGDISDNAPDGNSQDLTDECLARVPNGVDTDVDADDFMKTLCTQGFENNFTLIPINITNIPPQPSCILESDNIILSADITGSIEEVHILLDGDDIPLPGNYEGTYTYVINSSELDGSTNISWQFYADDIAAQRFYGDSEELHVNSVTSLEIDPEDPDGLNGWYIAEPVFILENPDAIGIQYEWDSMGSQAYTGPFGFEHAPIGSNRTGGILNVKYWSEVCNEPLQEFIGKFDFKNPDIEDLTPLPSSTTFNNPSTIVSAYLDEVYQSNSGINLSAVTMTIDGSPVPAIVEQVGAIDALVSHSANLSDGTHEVEVFAQDHAGRTSQTAWSFELVPFSSFLLTINLPTPGIYTAKRIDFNLTTSRESEEIEYINYNDRNPRYKRLCRDCDGYGHDRVRHKSLNEGPNNLTIRATDHFGGTDERSVSLTIDSKDPRITKTEPTRGFASGFFDVEFDEDSPVSLIIHYGNFDTGFREHTINLETECALERKYECSTFIDLTDYDGQEMEYYVSLEDIAGNLDESRIRYLLVDGSLPIISLFGIDIAGKKVTFTLNITEPFLDEVVYIDNLDKNPRERRLCSKLVEGTCEKKVSFNRDGDHNVTVIVRDEAGNEAYAFATFFTDSKDPKIKSTEPRRGFASGLFEVTFEEANPKSLFLNYGNGSDTRSAEVDLDSCVQDRRNTECSGLVNLSDFEEQEVTYWFNITDVVDNFDESNLRTLKVDTLPPRINEFNYSIDGRDVYFIVNVSETNFDVVEYKDRDDSNPKYKTLCTRLDEGLCEKTKRFRVGEHTLDLRALDEAGNEAMIIEGLEFIAA